jgi:hypothetical protein
MRRQQAQMIVTTIREAKTGRGAIPLRAHTPFIVLGDFNAIAGATSFVGAIVSPRAGDAKAGGRAEGLDWDRPALTDARPHHNASGSERCTWRNDLDRFQPGILDRILHSDRVLASVNQFVLDTTAMSYGELVAAHLRVIDVVRDPQARIHDHFPLVIDVVAGRPGRDDSWAAATSPGSSRNRSHVSPARPDRPATTRARGLGPRGWEDDPLGRAGHRG